MQAILTTCWPIFSGDALFFPWRCLHLRTSHASPDLLGQRREAANVTNDRLLQSEKTVTLMIARTCLFEKQEVDPKAVSFADQFAALRQDVPRGYGVPAPFSGNVDIRATAANPEAAAEIH
jgi:hypothetical protein